MAIVPYTTERKLTTSRSCWFEHPPKWPPGTIRTRAASGVTGEILYIDAGYHIMGYTMNCLKTENNIDFMLGVVLTKSRTVLILIIVHKLVTQVE